MSRYEEIDALRLFYENYAVKVIRLGDHEIIAPQLVPVQFEVRRLSFMIHVDDEYDDLQKGNRLLHLVLVLRELELYDDSTDYLDWCNQLGLAANNDPLRAYYTSLDKTYQQVCAFFEKEVDSFISDYDFGLNAGAAQQLRETIF